MSDVYNIDLDKLDEYITQLELLMNNFPEKKCTYVGHEKCFSSVEIFIDSTMQKINTAQSNLKCLIESTDKYMKKIRENVIGMDEVLAKNIGDGGHNN